jgi:hypothetical protein
MNGRRNPSSPRGQQHVRMRPFKCGRSRSQLNKEAVAWPRRAPTSAMNAKGIKGMSGRLRTPYLRVLFFSARL